MAKIFLQKIRKALIRLPRNLSSNRWYLVLNRSVYVFSPSGSRSWAHQLGKSTLVGGSKSARVYRPFFRGSLGSGGRPEASTTAIVLPHLGRFGNATGKLVGALVAADTYRVGTVWILGRSLFSLGGELPRPGIHRVTETLNLQIGEHSSPKASFTEIVSWSGTLMASSPQRNSEIWEATRTCLGFETGPSEGSWLTIHIRGGDVFGTREAKNYGQPPLSYYEKVFDHERATQVNIVYQDDLNPVFKALIQLCEERSITYRTQSGLLRDDIETLMGAQTLVAGRGTFLPAVVGLSPHIKRVYYFEDKFTLQPPRNGFEVFRVFDSHGDYRKSVLSGNWENRPEQRALMLSYPAARLKLEKEG